MGILNMKKLLEVRCWEDSSRYDNFNEEFWNTPYYKNLPCFPFSMLPLCLPNKWSTIKMHHEHHQLQFHQKKLRLTKECRLYIIDLHIWWYLTIAGLCKNPGFSSKTQPSGFNWFEPGFNGFYGLNWGKLRFPLKI